MSDLKHIVKNMEGLFSIDELVHPDLLPIYPDVTLWELFDVRLLTGLYLLRLYYDEPIWINGRGRKDSGFRPCFSKVGSVLSAHRTGHALDLHCSNIKFLQEICVNQHNIFGFTEIENPEITPGWCHISTRNNFNGGFEIINP